MLTNQKQERNNVLFDHLGNTNLFVIIVISVSYCAAFNFPIFNKIKKEM
jgi:hypothetical protein